MGLGKKVRAVTVYRVIRISSEENFQTDYYSAEFNGKTYVGSDVESSVIFAHGNFNSRVTMVLEMQIPVIMLKNPPLGLSGKYISYEDAPDIKPFLFKTGVVVWKNRDELTFSVNWKIEN